MSRSESTLVDPPFKHFRLKRTHDSESPRRGDFQPSMLKSSIPLPEYPLVWCRSARATLIHSSVVGGQPQTSANSCKAVISVSFDRFILTLSSSPTARSADFHPLDCLQYVFYQMLSVLFVAPLRRSLSNDFSNCLKIHKQISFWCS